MTRFTSQRGATLVWTSFALVALFAFSGFVIDWGIFWTARRQAQNRADAGALAGAISLAVENGSVSTFSGPTYDSIHNTANLNPVWGPGATTEFQVPHCPTGIDGRCVEVWVYRDGSHSSSAIPTYFLKLVGKSTQGTKAHAIATARVANTTNCLKPWMLPDWYNDNDLSESWTPGDTYFAPGYRPGEHLGQLITLRPAGGDSNTPSFYNIISDIGEGPSAPPYRRHIETCDLSGWIGRAMPTVTGSMTGPTDSSVETLLKADPEAGWDGTKVTGPMGMNSPRIVAIGLYDPTISFPGGKRPDTLTIVNFISVLLKSSDKGEVTGWIVNKPGSFVNGHGSAATGFLYSIQLIR